MSLPANPAFAAAQFSWGAGYLSFDKKENKEFSGDLHKLLQEGFAWLTGEFIREKVNSADPSMVDLPAFMRDITQLMTALPDTLSDVKKGLWNNATAKVLDIYKTVPEEKKDVVFAVLEVLAAKSPAGANDARVAIRKMADEGDVRALAKIERMAGLNVQSLIQPSDYPKHPQRQAIDTIMKLFVPQAT